MQKVLFIFLCLIYEIMNDSNHDYDHALLLIKLFISIIHEFDEKTCADNNFISSKGNFLSLLNMASQSDDFRLMMHL